MNRDLKKMRIMLDCESLSVAPNAALLSISAVAFDLSSKNPDDLVIDTFDGHIKIEDAMTRGGHVDPNTILWWMGQEETARRYLVDAQKHMADYELPVLQNFEAWINGLMAQHQVHPDSLEIWSNDELADAAWVANAFKRHKKEAPWPWWGVRCYRTMYNFFPGIRRSTVFEGTPHIGIDDAQHQVKVLWRIVNEGMANCSALDI